MAPNFSSFQESHALRNFTKYCSMGSLGAHLETLGTIALLPHRELTPNTRLSTTSSRPLLDLTVSGHLHKSTLLAQLGKYPKEQPYPVT